MTRPARARVAFDALRANLAAAKRRARDARCFAVVKADAYGHGLAAVGRALDDVADAFAVACVEEALALREAGVVSPVLLLEGVFEADEIADCARFGFSTAVHCDEQLDQLAAARPAAPLPVWLKIDTGMRRLGFEPDDARRVYARLAALPGVRVAGLMSHLACADRPQDAFNAVQRARFDAALAERLLPRSLANSAALLSAPASVYQWARPGLMLYGASPLATPAAALGLRPALTLETRLIAVKRARAGEAVGYGGGWRCPEDMPIGVAAIGYGDGYPRELDAGAPVLVDGVRVGLAGRVSMDMLTLDLRRKPDARVGATVTLWGSGLPVETVAAAAGTLPYTLLTGLTSRVPRDYAGG